MKFQSEDQRYDYSLTSDSLVVDVGGYHGDFSARIAEKYGCIIVCFEPIAEFRAVIRARNIPRMTLLPCAISGWSGIQTFRVSEDSTGQFKELGRQEYVVAMDAKAGLGYLGAIDLLKLNIEGDEYAVLRKMIDCGVQSQCENIQVQFHRVQGSDARVAEIREALSKTHEQTWCEDYVWENWRLKE